MGAFMIIYALTTIFSLAYCDEYAFNIDMPSIVNGFTSMATQAFSSSQALFSPRASSDLDADADSEVAGPSLTEKLQKVTWDMFGYMATMLHSLTRRAADHKANVEVGPGIFKSELLTYPENYYINRLKMLLKLKKKEEEKNKPLNKPE